MSNIKKIEELNISDIASICDHTFLSTPDFFRSKAKQGESSIILCRKAFTDFLKETIASNPRPYAVCVRPEYVQMTQAYFADNRVSDIKIASVVGFPDGNAYDTVLKVSETKNAIQFGANEIDMVFDDVDFKAGYYDCVEKDIKCVVAAAHEKNVIVKLILETSEFDGLQIKKICEMANRLEVDFVKTSTGYSASGAKAEDLKIMRANFPRGIKMSGGVNKANYKELLYAASGSEDGLIDLDPTKIRIGESSLLKNVSSGY